MKYQTYLPIFSGFYNTIWEPQEDNVIYSINQERKNNGLYSEINFDDLKIDYKEYEKDIVLNLCDLIAKELKPFVNSIEFEEIVSPREYNFKNDSANVIIEVKENEIASFIYANKEKFSQFLKERYTSRDGFISYYENDFQSWESITENFSDFTCDDHRIGAILDFIAIMQGVKEFDLFESIYEKICFLDYVENLNDVIEKQDGSLFEFLTSYGIEKNYADYIENSYNNGVICDLSLSEKILSLIQEYKTL